MNSSSRCVFIGHLARKSVRPGEPNLTPETKRLIVRRISAWNQLTELGAFEVGLVGESVDSDVVVNDLQKQRLQQVFFPNGSQLRWEEACWNRRNAAGFQLLKSCF